MKFLLKIFFFFIFTSLLFSQNYYLILLNVKDISFKEYGLLELKDKKIALSSLYKVFLGYYFLEKGILNEEDTFLCNGDGECNCWDKRGHGNVNVVKAISLSCNRFFCHFENYLDEYNYYLFVRKIFNLKRYYPLQFKEYFLKGNFSYCYGFTPEDIIIYMTSFLLNRNILTGKKLDFDEGKLQIVKKGMMMCYFSGTGKRAFEISSFPLLYMKTGTFKKRCGKGFIYRNLSYGLFKLEGNYYAILVFSLNGNSMNNSAVILGRYIRDLKNGF